MLIMVKPFFINDFRLFFIMLRESPNPTILARIKECPDVCKLFERLDISSDEYTSIIREHAKEVLLETVKKSPEIVCKDHKFVVCGCLNRDQGKILNEVFTDFTDVLYEKINKAEQKEVEDIIAKNTFTRK